MSAHEIEAPAASAPPSVDTHARPPRRNILLVIAYDGAVYHGWQRQAEGTDTVQLRIEQAVGRTVGHPAIVFGAGRTDAGVHAEGQTANFYTTNLAIPVENIRRATDSKLPGDIAVRSAVEVGETFHASRSATGKTYRYRLFTGPRRPVGASERFWWYPWKSLDVEAMRDAGRRLLGRHDFRGLAGSAEERVSTVRRMWRCDVAEIGPETHVVVEGDGFLYNMVRNIAGTLLEIGRGQWRPDRIDRILATCDRKLAGPTAPPGGLTLEAVHYGGRVDRR